MQAQSKNNTKFNFKTFIGLINRIHPRYWQLLLGFFLGVVATAMQLMVPGIAKGIINSIGHSMDVGLIVAVILLFVFSTIIGAFSGSILGFFGEDVVYKLRTTLWDKILTLPVGYFDQTKSGEITFRLVNDSTQVKELLANSVPKTATSILQLVGALVLMLIMDWRMTIIMFIAVPLVLICLLPIVRQSHKVARARQDALADLNGKAGEMLGEVRLVKSSTAENLERTAGDKRMYRLYRIGLKEAIYDSIAGPVMGMVMMAMVLGILGYGAIRVREGAIDIGTLFSFLMYLVQMISPFAVLGQFMSDVAKASGSTTRIQALLQTHEEDHLTGTDLDIGDQTLQMNHVSFSYDQHHPILSDVSFTAEPNSVIAFAGPSGGGKSTIFSLIERFYEPNEGSITIGNTNITDIQLADWRQQIGLVGQDAAIMSGTIRYNLTYGLPGHFSDDQLWHVLEMAYATQFVQKMPQGLDTEVGERGVKVSGGQRQRLAIARAFLRNPKILMLDEATASLDSESEMMVQKALDQLMANRTTLVIAHRLSTITNADEIYFIENGKVTGQGTHQQLVKTTPLYREYVNNQSATSNG